MKIMTYQYPKSSFLSLDKDMSMIVEMIMRNDSLKKMLHYTSKDCLSRPVLTEDETLELFGKNIKIVPKLYVDPEVLNYIFIFFDNFVPNAENPEFRNNLIEFDIVCHVDQWLMKDFQLRPFRIAAELDSMLNDRHLTGIGTLQFLGANQINVSDEFIGVCLYYQAIHGEEDKKHMPNPGDEEQFQENFNKIFNQ